LVAIEKQMGRPSKRPTDSPYTIDLHILYTGNLALNNTEIAVPHPRLRQRRFALIPLRRSRPICCFPGYLRPVKPLPEEVNDSGEVTRLDLPLFVRE
jgi:2-amino-4-hydroxy-6-hydroxymethyldihydropteridine diphosphokinase